MAVDYIQLIGSVGFPIVMCFYLMTRFEKVLNNNTKAIQQLIKRK